MSRSLILFLLPLILFSCVSFKKSPKRLQAGSYVYFLDKKILASGEAKLYVQEVVFGDSKEGGRYWIHFDPNFINVELYDNTWFDRLLKPTGDLKKATVGRLVRSQQGIPDEDFFESIRDKKDLFKFLPTSDVLPKSNMQVKLKATDFNQCRPSQTPPMRKNGKACSDRGRAAKLPRVLWQTIVDVLLEDPELRDSYKRGEITPAMIAAAAHLETRFNPLIENKAEKELCQQGPCTPYKWGRGIGQFGANETKELWNVDWQAPQNHKDSFVRSFEKTSRKLLATCNKSENVGKSCIRQFPKHIQNCREYEKRNNGIGHVFCFRPSFRMFALKMKKAFSKDSIVWQEKSRNGLRHVVPQSIQELINQEAKGSKKKLFVTSARLRAGYINRGAMINLSLQECVNRGDKLSCNYGNLSNVVGRRLASEETLGTPIKEVGAQILKGEFINRCHVWYFAGLCGPIRKDSLLDQYTRLYRKVKFPQRYKAIGRLEAI